MTCPLRSARLVTLLGSAVLGLSTLLTSTNIQAQLNFAANLLTRFNDNEILIDEALQLLLPDVPSQSRILDFLRDIPPSPAHPSTVNPIADGVAHARSVRERSDR